MSAAVRFTRAVAVALLLCLAPAAGRGQTLLGGLNTNGTPTADYYYGAGMLAVGWYYTAPLAMLINGVETQFAGLYETSTDRDVTVQILSDRPSEGGTLLREAVFSSAIARSGSYGGGSFTHLQLEAGQTVFIGFLNVGLLGINSVVGGTETATEYYDYDGFDLVPGQYYLGPYEGVAPIIRLMGDETSPPQPPETVVPEPASLLLLGAGLAGLAAARRRRRAQP